jgi:hypothetical protein
MNKHIYFDSDDRLPYCCGVNDVGGFSFGDAADEAPSTVNESGTGLFTATFINNAECKAAYEYLCKEHVLLFQSPKKKNKNSKRDVFLCVFLHKNRAPKKKKSGQSASWPAPTERRGEKLPAF